MHQDATWYGGRHQPRGLYVRWGPSPPLEKGGTAPPQFSANVRCGQTAGWTKMPLGMEVDLGPGNFVFDGAQLPTDKNSAVAEMGDCGHNRHGPKIGGLLCPFRGSWDPV